jgi:hypothetical protein
MRRPAMMAIGFAINMVAELITPILIRSTESRLGGAGHARTDILKV